jgi:Na+-driven multidrug efflux pump
MLWLVIFSYSGTRALCCGVAYSQTDGAKDRAKVGEAILRNSWLAVFGGCFGFCSADLRKNNIQYSAIEFKVIDIV